jgi:hypothetical protein
LWWLVKHLPPDSALHRAEDPAAVWTPAEHLLAIATNVLAELTYVTTVVNTEEKYRKQVPRPEPIRRPGETQPVASERRHRRPRVGQPLDPRQWGGAPIEATAQEVS